MKGLLISTVAAAGLALTMGTALAADGSNKTRDDGFDVFLQSQGAVSGQRSFLSGGEPAYPPPRTRQFLSSEESYPIGTDNGFSVYLQDQHVSPRRSFLSSEESYPIGTDNGFAVYLDDLHRFGR